MIIIERFARKLTAVHRFQNLSSRETVNFSVLSLDWDGQRLIYLKVDSFIKKLSCFAYLITLTFVLNEFISIIYYYMWPRIAAFIHYVVF